MDRDASASSCSVRRSRRPHSTPRNFMHENRETSETPAVQPDSRAAGKGLGRTARTDVSEESHSGILPMNYSNNDKTSSAESREGRPLIKENAGQPSTCSTQSGKHVSQGLAGVRKAARENKEMKFTALLHHLTVDLRRCGNPRERTCVYSPHCASRYTVASRFRCYPCGYGYIVRGLRTVCCRPAPTSRVAGPHYWGPALSEPYLRLSPYTAQALRTPFWGRRG